jgi:hypothetical protein
MTQGLDNKISNIIGAQIPSWVLKQLETRSRKNASDSRDTDNVLFIANKTAWIRLVSSIDVQSQEDLNYFKRLVGDEYIKDSTSLAKNFILFGGTSKYLDKNSYQLRSGLGKDGAYGMLGNKEIQDFGYRPMPGITSVTIDTQGRLGSVRAATINFKCWDKDQLDIIDALYFKLGFTMFLEWGHTYFYPNPDSTKNRTPDKIISTELYSIDPFQQGLTKEDINVKIAQNSRDSEGNYDAMLGMVTNFNFSYNQDGGFDCTIKLLGLGYLGDSIKINNSGTLPSLLEEEILRLNKTLIDIEQARLAKEAAAAAAAAAANAPITTAPPTTGKIKADDFFNTYIKYDPNSPSANKYSGGQISLNALDTEAYTTIDAAFNTQAYGWVYFIRRQKGFIPLDSKYLPSVKVTLDSTRILDKLNNAKLGNIVGVSDERLWKFPANYTDNLKTALLAPITTIVNFFTEGISSFFQVSQVATGDTQLDKLNDTGEFIVTSSSTNGRKYAIKIKRKLWAYSDRQDILDSYGSIGVISNIINYTNSAFYYIDTKSFVDTFKNVISTQQAFTIKDVNTLPNETTTTLFFNMPFTRKVKITSPEKKLADVKNPDGTITRGVQVPASITDADVTFQLYVEVSITDSSLIKSFTSPKDIVQPIEFTGGVTQPQQNQNTTTGQQTPITTPQKPDINAIATQIKQSLNYQSSLEIILRTIQVHALNKAINKTSTPDLDIGKTTYILDLWDPKDKVNAIDVNNTKSKKPFLNQIFSSGIFSTFIDQLVNSEDIKDSEYTQVGAMDPKTRFKINTKYGFATSLMGNKAFLSDLQPVNFKELLKAYVVPYQINQEIIKGTVANHPVYITLGQLLMILNHACTIYDTKKDSQFQTPLIYIDFNPELNFCLTNKKQLSTDPWTCLIPFEGSFEDFKTLFDKDILSNNGTAINSKEPVPLFNPETQDFLSGKLPKLKFDEQPIEGGSTKEIGNVYRGKLMNVLLNIDYLVQLVQQYSHKDGSNAVYLKTFLEQVLTDINKSLGNFNAFRLSYNDQANTYQIVDDQVLPTLGNESQLTALPEDKDNTTELPLLGKYSIAKSIEIKSEISSKLSNMLAISANSTIPNKATLSTNGDSFGFINTNFIDRYITDKLEPTGSNLDKKDNDALKTSAAQFNNTISDFYSKINPSQTTVAHATNYYIEKMTTLKNDDYATRASFMIPVSVNLTTDGISGFNMGQAFSIPDKLLPYTYTARKTEGFSKDRIRNVGFVAVGLTHKIENNQWDTSIRANMIFLKNKGEFKGNVERIEGRSGQFGVNATNIVTGFSGTYPVSGVIVKGKIEARPYTFEEVTAQVIAHLEGGYFHPNQFNDGRLAPTPRNKEIFQSSGETMFGIDRVAAGSLNTTTEGKAFWALVDAQNASSTWAHEYIPQDPLKTQLVNAAVAVMKPEFERLFNRYVPIPDLQNLIRSDGRLYFNFSYATWNGSGYFNGFSKKIIEAYNSGVTSPDELVKIFINLRLNIRQMPAFVNYANWAVGLMRTGGEKISRIVGVQLT